jgi:adiponectin receptor
MLSKLIVQLRKRNIPIMEGDGPLGEPRNRKVRVDGVRLLLWHELPTWRRDNKFILAGYRPASGSFCQSLKSLGHIHNETVNIYTHLLGAVIFGTLPFPIYSKVYCQYTNTQLGDIIAFSAFFWSVAVCFLLSASFHIVSNHSAAVAALSNHLDYLGIVILMWGSIIPSVYYGFYHEPKLQKLYWLMATILASTCAVATLHHRFHHPNFRLYRAAIYSSLGLSAICFIIHGLVLHGWVLQNRRMSLSWMGLTGGLNMIGAMVYAARIPERWHPRRHDIYGSSHQILHIMVTFAGLTHLAGLLSAFHRLHTYS